MSMNDEIAPEIAALLAATEDSLPEQKSSAPEEIDVAPSFDMPKKDGFKETETAVPVDLSVKNFQPITKFFSDKKNSVFSDPSYYKTALSGENDSAQKLHNLLSRYLTCTDQKDRAVYRQQMVTVYWEFIRNLAPKMATAGLPLSKRMLMRYAVVLPSLFSPEQKETFSSAFVDNTYNEPVFYLDEWFELLGSGRLTLSATDEARPQKKNLTGAAETQHLMQLKTKNQGKLQTAENLVMSKETERAMIEAELKSRIDILCDHQPIPGLEPHTACYTDGQKKILNEVTDRLRQLLKVDRDLNSNLAEYKEAREISDSLTQKLSAAGAVVEVSNEDINTEVGTVRQMAKMTVGRQGNHFPVFTREYFHCAPRQTGFRENVIDMLAWVESIDPGAFCRIHKNIAHRIVPYVVLVPTYGDTGFCWEPFDRYNRVTSRGRIVVPMYPKNLQIAVLTAVADLRWQVAKEKASYYWMEEGLTGQYYQWIDQQKLKGDLKQFFINDYVLWMTKESEGVQ